MSMQEYKSGVVFIESPAQRVFDKLSDLSNLESVKDAIPKDKVQEISFDKDSCQFSISPIGNIGLRIVQRTPFNTIKFESEQSPLEFNIWIQIVEKEESPNVCWMRLTLKADIPFMLKSMLGSKLEDAIVKAAEGLARLQY
ncbi:MAG: SRPBCC family protein [Bacteroidales bacterium]